MVVPPPQQKIRFGAFEADCVTGELYRNGTRVPIQSKPFRILELMLRAPDGVVTRQEIYAAIWPGVHVDLNRCLNTAIRKLRSTLDPEGRDPGVLETLGSTGYRFRSPGGAVQETAPGRLRLAVLCFKDLDPGREDGFCEGLTEQLIARIGREFRHVTVLAPTSMLRLQNEPEASRQAGLFQGLQADYALTGSALRQAGRIRLTVRLTKERDQSCAWADSFDQELADLFAIQDTLVQRIAGALQHRLPRHPRQAPEGTTSPSAYRKYLQALHFFATATQQGFGRAIALLEEVLAEDDRFAPARTSLALLHVYAAHYGPLAPRQAYPVVERLVSSSLELSPSLPESHIVKGMARLYYHADPDGAAAAFRQAIRLNPSAARAHLGLSQVCTVLGRHAQAIAALERALDLDPLAPELGVMLACAHFFAGDLTSAEAWIRQSLELHPGFPTGLATAGWIHTALGSHGEALRVLRMANALAPDSPIFQLHLAEGLAAAGEKAEAGHWLTRAQAARGRGWVPPYVFALVHQALGDRDRALQCLEQSFAERDGWRLLCRVDPRLASLVEDEGFRRRLSGMGWTLPPSGREQASRSKGSGPDRASA